MNKIILIIFYLLNVTLVFGQEPFSYQPEDIPKEDIPEGMTAKEYLDSVYRERHAKIKVTFHVVGEDGKPIPDADVNVGFDSLLHSDGYDNHYGKTDEKGLFTVEGRGQGTSKVIVKKHHYYPSMPRVRWSAELNPDMKTIHKNGGYKPWDPTVEVVLKKIGKPIPMIVRTATGSRRSQMRPTMNQIGKDMGWDLIVGDWTPPNGNGKVSDLIVTFQASFTNELNRSASVTVKCGNKNDGFIKIKEIEGEESLLKFPRTAPKNGYHEHEIKYSRTFKGDNLEHELLKSPNPAPKGYLFRLRTQQDAAGKIISAIYGKITNPMDFQDNLFRGERGLFLGMDYYLNPTPNDRNLEFDPAKNLAPEVDKDLRWDP